MKNHNSQSSISRSPRFVFIAGTLALTASLLPIGGANTAHAIDKADAYKTGAAALGVLGAYYGVKGKTLPAVIAGAGAYYAYKKGRDTDRENNRYPNRNDNRNNRNNRRSDRGNTYPDDYSPYPTNGDYRNGDYNNGDYNNGDYRNGDYRNGDSNNGDYRYPANDYPDDNRYPDNRNGNVYAGGYGQYPDYGYNGLKSSKSKAKSGPIRVK